MPFGWFTSFIPRDSRESPLHGGRRGKQRRRAQSKRAKSSRRRNR
jgi:hypothetical protein